ncbi:MAG: hypothetical protein LBJ00_16855 [Planctomycetaceae bacterium]|nr:hypothetical protein [Planctomycetaceae bacterium]
MVQKSQMASLAIVGDLDSFSIAVVTLKIEPLVDEEPSIDYQIRTVLSRQKKQWLARTEIFNPSSSHPQKIVPYFELFLAQNGQVLQWTSDNSTCQIRPFSDSNIYLYWDYIRYLGFNVYKPIAESNGVSYKDICLEAKSNPVWAMLNDLFVDETLNINAERYKVHTVQEKIDGFDCWVVEWFGMDKMWVDVAHGFAVRKRIVHFSPGGHIRQVVFNKDYRQIKPGVWLPYSQVVEEFADPEYKPRSLWGQPIRRVYYVVEKIDMDYTSVSNFFSITVPAGTYVIDSVRKMDFIVSNNDTDPFAEPIGLATSSLAFRMYRAIIIIVLNVVLLFLIWLSILKSRSRR